MKAGCAQRTVTGRRAGITLIELLVVLAIVGLMVGISYPSFSSGLDGIRLRTELGRAASFFSLARQQADRSQQPVQFTVDTKRRRLSAVAADGGWEDDFVFPDGIEIAQPKENASWILFPGAPAPRWELMLEARDGTRRGLRINVFTGVAEDWRQEPEE